MATTDSYGIEPTDNDNTQRRPLSDRLRELAVTVVDATTTAADIRPGPDFRPDGDWLCDDDGALCKTWSKERNEIEERVQLSSSGPSATWEMSHQRPDGTTDIVARDLERETAFKLAEQYMADLSRVPAGVRTGRAE